MQKNVVDTTCFDEYFLFHVELEDIIFDKSLSLLRFIQPPYCSIFETSVLKEVRILRILFPRCSANNGEVLIPKFQNKATVY